METSVTSSSAGGAANVVKVESRIGFLGGGQMALALGKGFMQSGLVAPSQVHTVWQHGKYPHYSLTGSSLRDLH